MQPRLPHFHPWQLFGTLTDWRLLFRPLPHGLWGYSNETERTVTLHTGLTQAQRRSTILHECGHILRDTFGHDVSAEELDIDRHVARLLMPSIHDVADALAFCHGDHTEAAHELWVDEQVLHVRLSSMLRSEREFMRDRMASMQLAGREVAPPKLRALNTRGVLALLGG